MGLKLVVISDTHSQHEKLKLPPGDVLIHCGDLTPIGSLKSLKRFIIWFAAQPHKHKIFIAGNHDWGFDPDDATYRLWKAERMIGGDGSGSRNFARKYLRNKIKELGLHYLYKSSVVIDGYKFHGSPEVLEFGNWAFGKKVIDWSHVPEDTDVLITHTPPFGVRDFAKYGDLGYANYGCPDLFAKTQELKKLKVHCFGHIHEARGDETIGNVTYINAASLDKNYEPVTDEPFTFELV